MNPFTVEDLPKLPATTFNVFATDHKYLRLMLLSQNHAFRHKALACKRYVHRHNQPAKAWTGKRWEKPLAPNWSSVAEMFIGSTISLGMRCA